MPNNRLQVLVTGATGFVGAHLCQYLAAQGYFVKAVGRKAESITHPFIEYHVVENINGNTDWKDILQGVQIVVHLAARVHQVKDKKMQSLLLYQETNVKGTQRLAKEAIKNEVKRFIYVSTIKVNGEKTIETPLRAEDYPRPQDAYSLSKLQAEQILQGEARRSGMEWVIIRPPLIYGPGVKGNFRRLLKLSQSCLPLPLSAIRNRRSLVSIYNLCSFIECCITHPHAASEVFLVSDNQDLSTGQLVRLIRNSKGKRGGLVPFPTSCLKLIGSLTGKRKQVDRMIDSLQVNIEKSARLLNWQAPLSVEASLKALYKAEQQIEINDKN